MKIYFKSDFEIIEQFLYANGEPIDINTLNIELCYQTDKYTSFSASFRNGQGNNCYIDEDDNSKLHVTFAEHKLAPGTLTRTATFFVDNNRFPDNTQHIRIRELTQVELVSMGGNNDSYSIVENVSTILLFDHNAASHRNDPDQHPIAAITGLNEALSDMWQLKVLTDWQPKFNNEGDCTFIGRNNKAAQTSDETWSIKVLWYVNNILTIHRFNNASWDNRYNLVTNNQ